jgi:hypothetical protein
MPIIDPGLARTSVLILFSRIISTGQTFSARNIPRQPNSRCYPRISHIIGHPAIRFNSRIPLQQQFSSPRISFRRITTPEKSFLFWEVVAQTYSTQACNTCQTGPSPLAISHRALRQLHPQFAAYTTPTLLQPFGHFPALIGRYMGSTVVISSHQSTLWDFCLQSSLHLMTTRMAALSLQSYLPALAQFLVGVMLFWTMSKQAESH